MAIVVAAAVLAGSATASVPMGLLTLAAFLTITWRTWLPIWVEIGPSGITQRTLGLRWRIPWSRIRHYEVGLHGVLFYFDETLTQLSPLRGLYLHWAKMRSALIANVEYYLYATTGRTAGTDTTELMPGQDA